MTLRNLAFHVLLTVVLVQPALTDGPSTQETPVSIARSDGAIIIDGELSEEVWRAAPEANIWFETNPGDNVEPDVASRGYLLFDDRYLYAAFEFEDPEPEKIRAPLGDHDNLPSSTDYAGIIVDTNNDGQTAQMFLANARGIKYDAISSDATGESSSPDFFWDAVGAINGQGWTLEIRIPLSSIRYSAPDWRVMLYRNYPRDRRYQMFTSRLPRDVNCFICNSRPLVGLEDLPTGGHFIIAPVFTAGQAAEPGDGLGSSLVNGDEELEPGLDVKWLPNPNTVIDLTVNPDFSQVESDVGQITANERFALFIPEKRPFFLEGIDLFATPVQAIYSRTFNAPRWGTRATGTFGKNAYTIMLGEDEGGGVVILPGPRGSGLADQDFESFVAMGRWRRDFGTRSFFSFVYTGREIQSDAATPDGGSNHVFGPDFQWRPTDHDTVTAQFLVSQSKTPNRPDLAEEWDGQTLDGYGTELWWSHRTDKEDWFVLYNDYSDDFRADNGFIPRVGYRLGYGEVGYTFRPERGLPKDGFLTRLRTFAQTFYRQDQDGNFMQREMIAGAGMDGKWSSFWQVRVHVGDEESIDEQGHREVFPRERVNVYVQLTPSRRFNFFSVSGWTGKDIDFANSRPADGASISTDATLRPSDHLEMKLNLQRRWLDVDVPGVGSGRLFTADLARLRSVYTFSSRIWLRLVAQWTETEREPAFYNAIVQARNGGLSSSLVFAYKLNWQSVLFVGYGDDRALDVNEDLQAAGRQLFMKISYAFQR